MAQYSVVLFDVGYTLLRLEPSDEAILLDVLETLEIPCLPRQAEEAWRKAADEWGLAQLQRQLNGCLSMPGNEFRSNILRTALERLCRSLGIPEHEDFFRRYASLPKNSQTWVPVDTDIPSMLTTLKAWGLRLGVVSNWDTDLPNLLSALGLASYFEVIIASGLEGIEKPDPQILLRACERMSVQPANCLYVGDHPFDVLCANRARMDAALVGGTQYILPVGLNPEPTIRLRKTCDILNYFSPEVK